jgi:hypothetical protein
MKSFIIILFGSLLIAVQASSQGCVAIRGTGNVCMMSHPDETTQNAAWQFSASSRYFKSFRHFSGTIENKARLVDGTEVINHQASLDLALTRIVNDRWSFMIDVPILSNSRSSLYEHGLVNGIYIKKERHTMHSFGIGDIRFAAYRWLIDPKKSSKGNIQLGLGIKLPTGDDNYKDYWYNVGPNGTKELRPVDQSIQLGDGGTGFTTEINTFYNFNHNFGMYGNFYYLINPREQNGVRTYRETLTPALANEAICSVPDQYMFRAGFNYSVNHIKGLSVAAGARLEGIPVHNLIGGSGDFRRPGYIWSIEPTIHYSVKKTSFFVSVPFAIVRNRTQSVTDMENSTPDKHVQGDAAFADYVVNVGMSIRF